MAICVHNEKTFVKNSSSLPRPPITKYLHSGGGDDSHSTAKEKFKPRKVKITPK